MKAVGDLCLHTILHDHFSPKLFVYAIKVHFVGVSVINLNVRCYFKDRNRRSSEPLRFLRTLTKSYAFKRLNYEIIVLSVNMQRWKVNFKHNYIK